MTPLQKLELRMSDLRKELAAALDADDNLTAAKLLEPEIPAPVITETRQFDSKLAELRHRKALTFSSERKLP